MVQCKGTIFKIKYRLGIGISAITAKRNNLSERQYVCLMCRLGKRFLTVIKKIQPLADLERKVTIDKICEGQNVDELFR